MIPEMFPAAMRIPLDIKSFEILSSSFFEVKSKAMNIMGIIRKPTTAIVTTVIPSTFQMKEASKNPKQRDVVPAVKRRASLWGWLL